MMQTLEREHETPFSSLPSSTDILIVSGIMIDLLVSRIIGILEDWLD